MESNVRRSSFVRESPLSQTCIIWLGILNVTQAGLFSAVDASFLVQAYQNLQPDYQQYTAALLFTVLTSGNTSNGVAGSLLPSSLASPSDFVAPTSVRWISGLWFTSLIFTLSTALICILAKQWLGEYPSTQSSSPQDWARRRQFRYNGLSRWHVPAIIATLPVLLHVSLFLFFMGLVILLWSLDPVTTGVIFAILAMVLIFYLGSIFLPWIRLDCPYRTPLLQQMVKLWGYVKQFAKSVARFAWSISGREIPRILYYIYYNSGLDSKEHLLVSRGSDRLDADAVQWLTSESPLDEVMEVAIQGIGGLS
jgi:hypothetical protein